MIILFREALRPAWRILRASFLSRRSVSPFREVSSQSMCSEFPFTSGGASPPHSTFSKTPDMRHGTSVTTWTALVPRRHVLSTMSPLRMDSNLDESPAGKRKMLLLRLCRGRRARVPSLSRTICITCGKAALEPIMSDMTAAIPFDVSRARRRTASTSASPTQLRCSARRAPARVAG